MRLAQRSGAQRSYYRRQFAITGRRSFLLGQGNSVTGEYFILNLVL